MKHSVIPMPASASIPKTPQQASAELTRNVSFPSHSTQKTRTPAYLNFHTYTATNKHGYGAASLTHHGQHQRSTGGSPCTQEPQCPRRGRQHTVSPPHIGPVFPQFFKWGNTDTQTVQLFQV